MDELILEVRPVGIDDEVLEKLEKRKSLIKVLWKLIFLGFIISVVFSISNEIFKFDEQSILFTLFGTIYAICIFSVFILFFPTIFTLADNRKDRSEDYIRVYADRIECVQTLDVLIKDKNSDNKERAIIYYDAMTSWRLGRRKPLSEGMSHKSRFDSMIIFFDNNQNSSEIISYTMNNDMFFISLSGYEFDTWWSALRTAYDFASSIKDIEYTTNNRDYVI